MNNELDIMISKIIPLLYERIKLLCQFKHKTIKNHRVSNIEGRIRNLKKAIEILKYEIEK